MADGRKKIFLSWSKTQSKQVALVVKSYLTEILEGIDIFMSDKDIDPGERSMRTIEGQLDGTSYGLLIVTEENQSEPWLNFEAGALSKYIGHGDEDVPRVVPLLVDISNPSQLTGPLSQFQAVQLDKAGLERTVLAIAGLTATDPIVISKRFNRAWSEFESELATARAPLVSLQKVERPIGDRVDEALEILRALQRTLPSALELSTQLKRRGDLPAVEIAKIASQFGLRFLSLTRSSERIGTIDVYMRTEGANLGNFEKALAATLGYIPRVNSYAPGESIASSDLEAEWLGDIDRE